MKSEDKTMTACSPHQWSDHKTGIDDAMSRSEQAVEGTNNKHLTATAAGVCCRSGGITMIEEMKIMDQS